MILRKIDMEGAIYRRGGGLCAEDAYFLSAVSLFSREASVPFRDRTNNRSLGREMTGHCPTFTVYHRLPGMPKR